MESNQLNSDQDEEIADEVGGEIDKSSVSLRFFDDKIDGEEITRLLNHLPSISYKKGDFLRDEITETGGWLLKGEKSSKPLENQISTLLSQLNENLEDWQRVTTKYKADLFCGLWLNGWNRGTNFSSEILKQISDRGLSVDLDIYCVGDEN